MNKERLGTFLMLAILASFWVQRDYSVVLSGWFPDAVMVVMAVLLVLHLSLSFTRYAATPNASESNEASNENDPNHNRETIWKAMKLVAAVVLLVLWVGFFRSAGFILTGTVGFAVFGCFLGEPGKRGKHALTGAIAGAVSSIVLYIAFGYYLLVPLPTLILFN